MSVLRQFKLFSAPQASPWPYTWFCFFLTSCCCKTPRQRAPASASFCFVRDSSAAELPPTTMALSFFDPSTGAAAVGGEVIVVVGQHSGAVHVFAGGADAEHARIAVADDLAQAVFGVAGAESPNLRGVAQLRLAVFDVEIDRLGCRRLETMMPS